jgi:hypothetical protein
MTTLLLTADLPRKPTKQNVRTVGRLVLVFLLLPLAFSLSYTQQPLFSSNQNHRCLHGMAAAGEGDLRNDWLVSTTDPTPVFSFLVYVTHRFLDVRLFYVYYALLQGGYLLSLAWIGSTNAGLANRRGPDWLVLTLLVVVHSWACRAASTWLTGTDIPWLLQAGMAGQYLLGPVFQPSVIGVFLVYSIAAFLAGRPWLAILCSSIALVVHPTYVLSAAFLTIAYLAIWVRKRHYRQAFGLAVGALVLASPVVVYNAVVFGPTDADTFAHANHLLAHWRFPHHCLPAEWFTWEAAFQAAFVSVSLFLIRDGRLLALIVISLLGTFVLTGAQIVTRSDALALLFPWRTSTYLVPLALSILLGRVVGATTTRLERSPEWHLVVLQGGCVLLLVGLVGGGCRQMFDTAEARASHSDTALFAFIRQSRVADHVYLIPPRRERFRLATGACIFVDHKSHPYKDQEVVAWFTRLETAQAFYYGDAARRAEWLRALARQYGVTHAVVENGMRLPEEDCTEIYQDRHYRVVQVRKPNASGS